MGIFVWLLSVGLLCFNPFPVGTLYRNGIVRRHLGGRLGRPWSRSSDPAGSLFSFDPLTFCLHLLYPFCCDVTTSCRRKSVLLVGQSDCCKRAGALRAGKFFFPFLLLFLPCHPLRFSLPPISITVPISDGPPTSPSQSSLGQSAVADDNSARLPRRRRPEGRLAGFGIARRSGSRLRRCYLGGKIIPSLSPSAVARQKRVLLFF